MALRVYAKVAEAAAAYHAWDSEGGAAYYSWVRDPEGQLVPWNRSPTSYFLSNIVLHYRDAVTTAPTFSVSDFSFLCALLTQEEEVRGSILASGINSTRSDLDSGRRQDVFWESTVSKLYN